MPLNSEIANLMVQAGRDRAAGIAGSADAWSHAISQIGQQVGQLPQQMEAQKQRDDAQRARDARNALSDALKPENVPTVQQDGLHLYDVNAIGQFMSKKGFGAEFVPAAQHLDTVNQSMIGFQQARLGVVQSGARALLATAGKDGVPTGLMNDFLDRLDKNQVYAPETVQQYRTQFADHPESAVTLLRSIAGPQKPVVLPYGAKAVDPISHEVVADNPREPQLPTDASLAMRAAGGDAQAAAALKIQHPDKPEKPDTATQDNQRYIKIQTDKRLGKTLSPEDQAWSDSYVQQRTLGPEAASAAASLRQANTIAQQNALQQHQQDFVEAQAGRKELTEKVEQPYLDATEKTATLRRTVALAQSGNKEAANLTPLLATLGVVTSEGVKRINKTEVDQVAGAGSVLDRIESKVGKLVKGQPLPADLQKDIVELSSMLEEGARKKYEQSFDSTVKRYGLKDEVKLPKPTSSPSPSTGPVLRERRMINGQIGEWDGTGWKPVVQR